MPWAGAQTSSCCTQAQQPLFRLPWGSGSPSLLNPSPAIPQHAVLKPRIRAPLQNQSSCLPSLLNTQLLCLACDLFQLLWSNLPRPAVPPLTPSACCLVLCRFPWQTSALLRVSSSSSLRNKAGHSPRRGFMLF